jgi:hypothetical protein
MPASKADCITANRKSSGNVDKSSEMPDDAGVSAGDEIVSLTPQNTSPSDRFPPRIQRH